MRILLNMMKEYEAYVNECVEELAETYKEYAG
jgi:hypothetical protein